MSTIVFRADAASAIGMGHVVRCATLGTELAARGARVHFICRELPGHACDWLAQRGFQVTRLRSAATDIDADIAQCRAALDTIAAAGRVEWLVVDHYGLDARWETALRPLTQHILVIDDLPARTHDCDLLLDPNLALEPTARAAGLRPSRSASLQGPRYALLRPEFAAARAARPERDGQVRRVLICFGGSDPQQHTLATLSALRPYAARLQRIDVVVGPANPHAAALAALCAELPGAVLHCPANDMAALLNQTDLAIGAGGTMSWERACLGVPTLGFGIADNQEAVLAALIEHGALLGCAQMPQPDANLIAAWLDCVFDNPALLRGLATRSLALVDGQGAQRVADCLLPRRLAFRAATLADSANLLHWRNHPQIRQVSLDPREIGLDEHQAWLQRVISDPQRRLLIAEQNGEPVGVVRFDLQGPDARISVYRVPTGAPTRAALVGQASAWLRSEQPQIQRIVADVLHDNAASLAAFRAAGYREAQHTLVLELETP